MSIVNISFVKKYIIKIVGSETQTGKMLGRNTARPTPTEIKFITPKIGWIPLDVGAGPIAGGLTLTKDGGKNFTRVGSDNEMGSVLEVDFVSAQQGWAVGTALNQGDYLTRTTDGGQTWTQVYPRLSPTQGITFVDNQHGFGLGELADAGALLYTADGGDTWQQIYSFGEQYRPSMLSFVNRNLGWILAASTQSKETLILRTTDGGNNWTSLDGVNQTTQLALKFASIFRFFNPENGLIVISNAIENTFWRTQDGGQTWCGLWGGREEWKR